MQYLLECISGDTGTHMFGEKINLMIEQISGLDLYLSDELSPPLSRWFWVISEFLQELYIACGCLWQELPEV